MGEMSLHAAYELMRDAVSHGEHEKVAGVARHILQYFPQNLKAKLYLGEALIAMSDWATARTMFGEVCDSDPENIVAQIGLSTVAEREGNLAEATQYLERAMEIRPDMGELRPRLLNLYQRTARHDVYLHLSRSGLARLFMRSHAYSQAIPEFHQMAMANPERRENVVALVEALWRNGDEAEAHEICQQVLQEVPHMLKVNLIEARYYATRDDAQSAHYWQQAQALDPLLETAHELFGGAGVPATDEWLLPAWDDTAWYVQQVQSKAHSGVRMQYLVTSQMPTLGQDDVSMVLAQMRQMPRIHESDHSDDCACMLDEQAAPDSTGVLLQRTLERQAALRDQVVPTTPLGTASEPPAERDAVVTYLDNRRETRANEEMAATTSQPPITTPVAPDHDEIATEPVQMLKLAGHDPVDDDDRFLASIMQKMSAETPPGIEAPEPAKPVTPTGISRLDTTTIRAITSSDDLYVLLARLELRHAPAPTEDLRDVVARTLGGGLVERVRVSGPRDERAHKSADPVSLETLLNIDSPDALAVDLTTPAATPPSDNLLASLLSQPGSGLTEGMRGTATPPGHSTGGGDIATRVNDVAPDETLTELLSRSVRDERVIATDAVRGDAADATSQDALLAMLEDTATGTQAEPPVSDGTPVAYEHDFPVTGMHAVVNVDAVVRDLGLTSGELHDVANAMPPAPVSDPVTPKAVELPTAMPSAPTSAVDATSRGEDGNLTLDEYLRALQDDPENGALRLSVARVAIQCRMYETALTQYRHLIRTSMLLEDVTNDLRDVLAEVGEPQLRRDCSRLLGNAYARQSRVQEAVEAYRMTLNSGPTPLL